MSYVNKANVLFTVDKNKALLYSIVTVSYTHLDVYKRQGILRAGYAFVLIFP